jgi:hypothetical protein
MRRKLAILLDATAAALVVGAMVVNYPSFDDPQVPFMAGINLTMVTAYLIWFWVWEPNRPKSALKSSDRDERHTV